MNHCNISTNIIHDIKNLYDKASSAVYLNGVTGNWFQTTGGVRQGCLLPTVLFTFFLERMMSDELQDNQGIVRIGGRTVRNVRFADDMDEQAGWEQD